MNIEGTYTLQASPPEVWNSLLSEQVLLHTLPGVEHVEKIDDDTYTVTIAMRSTPFKGNHQARIKVTEQQFPYHYRLLIEGQDPQGAVSYEGSVHLHQHNTAATVIAYKGTLTTRSGSHFSSRLIKGGAKLFIQQYFHALGNYLRAHNPTSTENALYSKEMGNIAVQNHVLIPPPPLQDRYDEHPLFTKFAHMLHLGQNDPEQERQWGNKLQRIGFISSLLFLVWVGMHIPRRRT